MISTNTIGTGKGNLSGSNRPFSSCCQVPLPPNKTVSKNVTVGVPINKNARQLLQR